MKPLLLDLFCCGGGASEGYRRAGFDVVGVDWEAQPHYPFPFLRDDAMAAMDRLLDGGSISFGDGKRWYTRELSDFAVIAASPPCQEHSALRSLTGKTYEDFIDRTRVRLMASGLPYIIENVMGAPLIEPVMLCGSMFGLGATCRDGAWRQLRRHRIFESNFPLSAPSECRHEGEAVGVYGHGGGRGQRGFSGNAAERRQALGIDWMTSKAMSQAIPPAYTEFLGRQLLAVIG